MKTIKTECPYCHAQTDLTIDAGIEITEPVKRTCPTCWKRKMENVNSNFEKLLPLYTAGQSIEKSKDPTCPGCNLSFRNFIDVYLENDGDTTEITCPGCGVTFTTEISMQVTFCNKILEIEP